MDTRIKEIQDQINSLQNELNNIKNNDVSFGIGEYRKYDRSLYRINSEDDNGRWFLPKVAGSSGCQTITQNSKDLLIHTEYADDEFIESALIKEANRRGFECDLDNIVKFKPIKVSNIKVRWENEESELRDSISKQASVGGTWIYDPDTDTLINSGWGGVHAVYHKGKWAELVDEPITINGYEVKFKNGYATIGCAQPSNEWFKETSAICKKYGVSMYRECEDITQQIKQIADRL